MKINDKFLLLCCLMLPLSVEAQEAYDYLDYVQPDSAAIDSLAQKVEETEIIPLFPELSTDSVLAWPRNVQARLDQLLTNSIFETTHVGLQVYDISADSVIYQYNHRQRMRPASTMKVLTAVTALDCLDKDYQLKTQMRYTGKVTDKTLRGDLFLKGTMDPLFDSEDLKSFVGALRELGVDTIRGNIYADKSFKDTKLLGEGWCWDDDNPVLSPLLVDGKDRFMKRFCQEMRHQGIVHIGDTLQGVVARQASLLATRNHTLDEVLDRMLKVSDNLHAEAVFYHIAAMKGGRATAKTARQQVNKLIQRVGMEPSDYYVADGSGLSLYNYVSPMLEVRVLRYAYEHPEIYNRFLPQLPIAGEDGTLEKRMKTGAAHNNVKAKTGTVDGVASLAGYCTAANGHLLCFSIINMGVRRAVIGRDFQDRVCEALCR